jgi:hypothetical protein
MIINDYIGATIFFILFMAYFGTALYLSKVNFFAFPRRVSEKIANYLGILGDVVLGIGISALANKFDYIITADFENINKNGYVIIAAILLIVFGSIMRHYHRQKERNDTR